MSWLEIIELAKSKGYEFVDTDPQSNYPDALDDYRKKWTRTAEYGEDDEELLNWLCTTANTAL